MFHAPEDFGDRRSTQLVDRTTLPQLAFAAGGGLVPVPLLFNNPEHWRQPRAEAPALAAKRADEKGNSLPSGRGNGSRAGDPSGDSRRRGRRSSTPRAS